jgi:hypothetical protein
MRTLQTDLAMVTRTVQTFCAHGDVTELRILNAGRRQTISGYFDNSSDLVGEVVQWSGTVPAVYMLLNPCNPALLARAVNHTNERVKITTSDTDITVRRHFPIDFDPVRPAGISSTDEAQSALRADSSTAASLSRTSAWGS